MLFLIWTSLGRLPRTAILPEVGWRSPSSILIVVLLPDPLGPNSP